MIRLAAVLVAALVAAPSAFAHAEVSPSTITTGSTAALALAVPTESATAATVRVVVGAPPGLVMGSAMWAGHTRGVVRLRFRARADKPGDYALHVRQTYSDGSVVRWTPVVRAKAAHNANRDRLLILLLAAAAVVGWFALRRARQRP